MENKAAPRRTLSVLVDNEPGVLARVTGLISGRGFNIESLPLLRQHPPGPGAGFRQTGRSLRGPGDPGRAAGRGRPGH